MFQLHYRTAAGKMVILYPQSQREIEEALKKLAKRHIESTLRFQGRKIGETWAIDPTNPTGRYGWFYERGPIEMRL
jgi:hypothetical protein